MTKNKKKRREDGQSRNAENHAALLAVVGEAAVQSAPVRRILLFHELKEFGVYYSRRHLDRMEMAGLFPKRVPLGAARVGWLAAEVIAHVDRQIKPRSLAVGTSGGATVPAGA